MHQESKFRFGLRALMCLMVASGFAMFGWLQYCNYLRTHVFVQVLDQESGGKLARFEYQFRIVTSDSIPDAIDLRNSEDFSEWTKHEGAGPLTLKVPEHCRLEIHVRALDLDGGYEWTSHEELVLPELSHEITIRVKQGNELKGIVLDAETKEPLQDVSVSCGSFNDDFAVKTDAAGRFHIRSVLPDTNLRAVHRRYRIREQVWDQHNANEEVVVWMTKARRIVGQVFCKESGRPLEDCIVSQAWRDSTNGMFYCGAFGGGYTVFPERRETTDHLGRFVFYFDDATDSSLVISKQGWVNKQFDRHIDNSQLNLVSLDLDPCILRGKVVNRHGEPVTEFDLQAEVHDSRFYHGKETTHVVTPDGKFEIRSPFSAEGFAIRAESDGSFYFRRHWSINEGRQVDLLNLTIVLQDELSVIGQVVGDIETKKLTELTLLRGYAPQSEELVLPAPDNLSCWSSKVNEQGEFCFEGLTSGEYTLVTQCNGYVVNKRPVTIRNEDVVLNKIELPRLQTITGVIELANRTLAKIDQFNLECEGQIVPFRTNHRGEFSFDKLPVGRYTIRERKRDFLDDLDPVVATFNFQEKRANHVSLRELPLLELDLDSVGAFRDPKVELKRLGSGSVGSTPKQSEMDHRVFVGIELEGDFETKIGFSSVGFGCELYTMTRLNSRESTYQVRLRSRVLNFDNEDLHAAKECVIELQEPSRTREHFFDRKNPLSLIRNSAACLATILERKSGLSVNNLEDESIVEIHLLRDREMLGVATADAFMDSIPIVLADRDPNTCIIRAQGYGWAMVDLPKNLGDPIRVPKFLFRPGVSVSVQCYLDNVTSFPKTIRLSHSEGAEISRGFEGYFSKETFGFRNIWPGRWSVELLGEDPVHGEIVLDQRGFLVGSDSVFVELGRGD